jgi:hypothetical protein
MLSSLFSSIRDDAGLREWLKFHVWTPESIAEWQRFYNTSPRIHFFSGADNLTQELVLKLPSYEDIPSVQCNKALISSAAAIPDRLNLLIFATFLARLFFQKD